MEDEPIDFNPPATVKTIDVNFDFMTARNEFDMSLRPFVATVFDQDCPVVALAESIATQTEIGTFLVTDATDKPEDNLIGFITLLPIVQGSHLNYPHVYLGAKGDISIINNRRAALFLCERVINMPSELIPHLHNQLMLDLEWAEGNCEGVFCYDYVVSLSRCIFILWKMDFIIDAFPQCHKLELQGKKERRLFRIICCFSDLRMR